MADRVWGNVKDMTDRHKRLLAASEAFLKEKKIPDPRLAIDSGRRHILKFGRAIDEGPVVQIWAKEQNRPLAHVWFTPGGTPKRLVVFEGTAQVNYQLINVPELGDYDIAGICVTRPSDSRVREPSPDRISRRTELPPRPPSSS